jgi:hypothetical protein
MKTLSTELTSKGWSFKQLQRSGNVAIYQRSFNVMDYYETIIVQERKEYIIAGNTIPEHEAYPGDEEFGITAWCFVSLESATKKFNQLVEEINAKFTTTV